MSGGNIDPKARPYGMQAVDLIAELAPDLEVTFPPTLEPYQQELLASLGVRVRFDPRASMPTTLTRKRRPTGSTTREMCLGVLEGRRELATGTIARLVGRDYHTVVRCLSELARERVILRPRRGYYQGR